MKIHKLHSKKYLSCGGRADGVISALTEALAFVSSELTKWVCCTWDFSGMELDVLGGFNDWAS